MDVTWEALKDQRKMPHGLERFFKNEPRDAIAIYLQRLLDEGIDISDFRIEDLLDSEEDLVRYKRGLSEKKIAEEARKAKKPRLGESSGTKAPAPLKVSSSSESEPQPESETEPHSLNLSPQNSPPHSPEPEPELTIPTLEEAIIQVAEASVQKIKSLAKNSEVSDDPKSVRTHWNRVISWMTSESYRLKSISEQVRNGYIRDSEERLQERLAREAEAKRLEEERLAREAEEEAKRLEEERLAKEAELLRIREAEAKAQADAEAQAAAEAEAQQALIQGESSSAIPLILNTLKEIKQDQQEIKKDQNELRARMDKQDALNENIQNMFAMLLQRLPQPPNP
ncbi:hypothetical protein KIW84_064355 [Lathyrus oleraceus]|uniref:Uncharacterized protein n=1 Tax=Pisum sativum TaxID=3888 RepID=A0A9D5A8Z3_PEA|nr:hypothetical protein KIW84_064355 [Pisum sativum]